MEWGEAEGAAPSTALGHVWEGAQVDCSGVVWPLAFGSVTALCLALCAGSENLLLYLETYKASQPNLTVK